MVLRETRAATGRLTFLEARCAAARFRIAWVMVAVAIIALDFQAIRALMTFHSYRPGRTYPNLSDGTKWHQQYLTDEPMYGEDPNAKLLSDAGTGIVFLDVQGTSAIVRVFQAGGRPTHSARTFWNYALVLSDASLSSSRL